MPEEKTLPERFVTTLPSPIESGGELDQRLAEKLGGNYGVYESFNTMNLLMFASILVTFLLVGMIWFQFRRARDQIGGGSMFGFSRSPAKRYQQGDEPVTFKDVAGLESVKEDLAEVVDFLKHPKKFERLGARIPKGILMCGPPGTGKTLLARAIAGEADVSFYSINASEFIQMFVGVGASRVRDMFDVARANAPAILFIDEIDAVGRLRGTGIGGGNDEREQTLNQILSEMDGFATNDVVIVIAATNRPDVLDPALLRPGRFDRQVMVSRPAQKGRLQLFEVHTRKVPLASDVNMERLASMTTGLTGADIRNIVNEAALWACRGNKDNVSMSDFYYAIDKVLMGAKREEVISEEEKRATAYHEAGHTLIAWLTPGRDRISKVSIIPRGKTLGVTQLIPEEDRVSISQKEIEGKLLISLGGREAERLVFNELSAGAEGDLEYVTQLAQKMVTAWGMSERIGPAAFRVGDEHPFLGKEMSTQRNFSDKTAQIIDEEIMRILNHASEVTAEMLAENRNKLDALAQALEIREELDEAQIEQILGPPKYRRKEEKPSEKNEGKTGGNKDEKEGTS
ncbi:MAG: ATP-dependent zinc metalloprotease FtsH [Planctomycetia bacterium]|nr:ATP-dependent zinc metalloprotease FtsH [Planctomycetia bacterium]